MDKEFKSYPWQSPGHYTIAGLVVFFALLLIQVSVLTSMT